MLELLKKTMLTGVGLAVLTKDKVEELGRELVKHGETSEKEGQQFVDELLKKSEEAQKDFESNVNKVVHKILDGLELATKQDIAALTAKIESLEQRLARSQPD